MISEGSVLRRPVLRCPGNCYWRAVIFAYLDRAARAAPQDLAALAAKLNALDVQDDRAARAVRRYACRESCVLRWASRGMRFREVVHRERVLWRYAAYCAQRSGSGDLLA